MPCSAPGHDRREREVRVHVRAGHAVLEARQALLGLDGADRRRAVVVAPGDGRRGPAVGHEALRAVDRRAEDRGRRRQRREQAGDGLARERVGLPGRPRREQVLAAVRRPQRHVDVARRAGPVLARLGHERRGAPVGRRHRLHGLLEQERVVGRAQGLVVADVDLDLALARLAVRRLQHQAALGRARRRGAPGARGPARRAGRGRCRGGCGRSAGRRRSRAPRGRRPCPPAGRTRTRSPPARAGRAPPPRRARAAAPPAGRAARARRRAGATRRAPSPRRRATARAAASPGRAAGRRPGSRSPCAGSSAGGRATAARRGPPRW